MQPFHSFLHHIIKQGYIYINNKMTDIIKRNIVITRIFNKQYQ